MPEWNLVKAKQPQRGHASSKLVLPKLLSVCFLVFAVLCTTMQTGCCKIRSGGLDRGILRSSQTVPEVQARPLPSSQAQFANDPSQALRELNEANGEFEQNPAAAVETKSEMYEQAQVADSSRAILPPPAPIAQSSPVQSIAAPIIQESQQLFATQQREIQMAAVQPPAPSLKNSFEADSVETASQPANLFEPNSNVDRVLLGGVSLAEIEPINPAKVIAQCDDQCDDHTECDCIKEKLKPVLPFAQPIQLASYDENVPPSELVSQPLAPILFDETTRQVEDYDEQQTRQNQLRVLGRAKVENEIVAAKKLKVQLVPEQRDYAKTEYKRESLSPTVDPNLGRELISLRASKTTKSDASNRRPQDNRLRPAVASERIPPPAKTVIEIQAPIEVQGQFLPAEEVAVVEKADYSKFTTEDWTEIFGPPELPTQPHIETKNLRSDFQAMSPVSPLPVAQHELADESENQFQVPIQNDFLPIASTDHSEVELVVAEVPNEVSEPASWVPPVNSNFSPIPNSVRARPAPVSTASVALTNAANRGTAVTLPDVDTHVEVEAPAPKPEVVVEIVDNTVPWSVKLAETIENVRRQQDNESDPMARNGIEVNLRLLEVLQRQMVTVEENRSLMPNSEADFWQHQLDAIALMLPSTSHGVSDLDRHNTAHQTLAHLRKAVERLESIAALKVSAGKFCTEITGFGKYKPFASSVFKSGQKTLVYCEVEYYTSNNRAVNSESSYHTRLRGSYVIYDSQGRVVQQSEYPAVEDVARNRRRDFYMYFPIQVGELAAGDYKLDLLVEDLSSNKTAALKPGLTFQVR